MRVISPDVGGGFGTKLFPYREYPLAGGRREEAEAPVKWIATAPSISSATRRAATTSRHARMALDADGKFLAMDVDLIADMGAYLSTIRAVYSRWRRRMLTGALRHPGVPLPGPQRLHQHRAGRRLSRRRPTGGGLSGRAAGRRCARDTGMTPDAIRRRNFIPPRAMPYKTATGKHLRYRRLRRASEARAGARRTGRTFRSAPRRAKKHGQIRGIGIGHLCRGLRLHGRARPPMCALDPDGTSPS